MTDLAQQIRDRLDGLAAPGPTVEFPETMTAEDRQAFRDAWLAEPVPRIYTAPAVGRPLTAEEMDEWKRRWDAEFADLPQQPLKILPPGPKFYPGFEQMRAALLAVVDLAVAHQQYGPVRVPQGVEGRIVVEKHAAAAEALAVAVAEIAEKLGIEADHG